MVFVTNFDTAGALYEKVLGLVVAVGRVTPEGLTLLGTAFSTTEPGKLATASHVAGRDDNNLVVIGPKLTREVQYQDTSDRSVQYIKARIENMDPFRDIAILTISNPVRSPYGIGSADDIRVGEGASVFGFPHADFGRLVLTQQHCEVGARVLITSGGIKSKHVVLNIQARPGQSGGPIFNRRSGTVIGMMIGSYAPGGGGGISLGGVDPYTLHQTTHAVSAEYIREML